MPSYGAAVPSIVELSGIRMKGFPIPYHSFAGRHIVFNGGGYFRLMPYGIIKKWTKEVAGIPGQARDEGYNEGYCLSYIHPRDLDAGQPMLAGLPLTRKFKSYVGLKGAETKLRKYLTDFQFTDISSAAGLVDWDRVEVVRV